MYISPTVPARPASFVEVQVEAFVAFYFIQLPVSTRILKAPKDSKT